MRAAYRILISLVALAAVVQIGFAGYGAFNAIDEADAKGPVTKATIENGFDPHGALGTIILGLMIVLLLVALLGRAGVRVAAILLALGIAQLLLAWGATDAAWVGFLHGVNGLAIAAVAGSAAGRAWAERRVASEP